jgi:hypothetical protein
LPTIDVDAKRGDDSGCPGQNVQVPCRSLVKALGLLQECGGDMRVQIKSGDVALNDEVKLTNVSNFEVAGNNLTYVRCEAEGAGLLLEDAHNFKIVNLTLVNCTANFERRSAMLINSSSNFTLENMHFENSSATALMLLNNTEHVLLDNVFFVGNSYPRMNNSSVSHPGALSIQQQLVTHKQVHFRITNSVFRYNQSPELQDDDLILSRQHFEFVKRGYGGAIFVEFSGSTSNCSLIVDRTHFINNSAVRGGAMYAYIKDESRSNRILILNSMFMGNRARLTGGGINLGISASPSAMNTFEICDCTYVNNSALIGAGLSIFSVYGTQDLSHHRTFTVVNSTWKYNTGTLSPAVDIGPLNNVVGEQGYLPTPSFINCTFEGNAVQLHDTPKPGYTYHDNVGVFSATQIRVLFGGTTIFRKNFFSAILLESAVAEFERNSTVLFEDNRGFSGGAVAMYSFSTILFNINTDVKFSRNHARDYGGAIFYRTSDQHGFLRGYDGCFLRNNLTTETDWELVKTIKVLFENNTVGVNQSSDAIYADSFISCIKRCQHFKEYGFEYTHAFSCTGNFTFLQKGHPLTSSGRTFCFSKQCKDEKNVQYTYQVNPGGTLSIPFNVVDDFHQVVTPLLRVMKHNSSAMSNTSIHVANPYTLVNEITITGQPNATSDFTITAVGVREIYFVFQVTLLPCPPGYVLENNSTCKCADEYNGMIIKCDNSKFHAKYKGSHYVGYIPSYSSDYRDLYFAACVGPICNASNHHLPKYGANLTKKICAKHRVGIMCGKCEDGYATYYHSRNFTCGPIHHCHMGSLFYVLSEILPMVAFFIIVVTFDLSFTSGMSVGFIFFTQYPNDLTIDINPVLSYIHAPYRLFYGLFNFNFFHLEELSFCLWNGAQVLDILAVKYITILIALGLVLAFIAILHNNSCNKLCHLRRQVSAKTSVVKGLSAFLMICYAQCTKTSFYILRVSIPLGYKGKYIGYYSYYGGLPYFQRLHLIYVIPALISLVLVTIFPPLVLLLYPLSLQFLSLCGLSEHWIVNKTLRFTGINKLKPFIDCFQSCYKDNLRFFAGLYFVYKVAILVAFTISGNSLLFSIYSEVVMIIWLGIHSVVQPYKERLHNILDSLVFFNLALINGCVIIMMESENLFDGTNAMRKQIIAILLSAFQLLLLYIPMVVALVYLAWQGCRRCKAPRVNSNSIERVIEVDDILEHDSDHNPLLSASSSLSTEYETTRRGSIQDTY